MGLVEDEVMSLRDLMYGMMMVSAGDATWAISEHVAGSVDNMIIRMNAKAVELGLANTVYCHDAGSKFSSVGYSTAREQAVLWATAYDHPEFIEISGRASATLCGTLPDDSQLCHPNPPPMTKNMTQYIELDGWKNGNGGASCAAYAALPGCSDCLTAQATRLDRSVVAAGTRSVGVGATWSDTTKMFDYSYRQIFTPDWRGDSGAQGGATTDFGIDAVDDMHTTTAVLPGGTTLRVCNWAVNIGLGTLTKTRCTDRAIAGLTAGGTPAIPQRLAIVPVSEIEAEDDYVVGRVTAGALKLTAWRVGQKNF
jgi:D-alanyl-D-alanine carboxypeptidase